MCSIVFAQCLSAWITHMFMGLSVSVWGGGGGVVLLSPRHTFMCLQTCTLDIYIYIYALVFLRARRLETVLSGKPGSEKTISSSQKPLKTYNPMTNRTKILFSVEELLPRVVFPSWLTLFVQRNACRLTRRFAFLVW